VVCRRWQASSCKTLQQLPLWLRQRCVLVLHSKLLPASGLITAGSSASALQAAALMHVQGHRVLLALCGALAGAFDSAAADGVRNSSSSSSSAGGGSSSSGSGRGDNSKVITAVELAAALTRATVPQKLASLLATVLKTASAHAAVLAQQQHSGAAASAIDTLLLNQAALVVDLSRRLDQLCNAKPDAAAAAAASSGAARRNKSTSRAAKAGSANNASSASSSRSSSGDSVAVDRSRQLMALAGKGLLLLSQWGQQADKQQVERAALLRDSTEEAWQVLHDVGGLLPLSMLLHSCSDSMGWLGSQLAAVGLPGLGGTKTAAAQKAAENQLKQQAAASEKLQEAAAAAEVFRTRAAMLQVKQLLAAAGMEHSRLEMVFDVCAGLADDIGTSDADQECGLLLHSKLAAVWKALESFAGSLVVQCPVDSSCGNPACVGFCRLSEKKLVFGTKNLTVCTACKEARFCSRECFQQVWEQHRPVCRRLRPVTGSAV
jgi:hypothetical protein